MGLKPKLTYAKDRNPHEDFSEDEFFFSTQGIPIYLKILKATRRRQRKKIFPGLHQPKDKKN
jgi:hypothetical protein